MLAPFYDEINALLSDAVAQELHSQQQQQYKPSALMMQCIQAEASAISSLDLRIAQHALSRLWRWFMSCIGWKVAPEKVLKAPGR